MTSRQATVKQKPSPNAALAKRCFGSGIRAEIYTDISDNTPFSFGFSGVNYRASTGSAMGLITSVGGSGNFWPLPDPGHTRR
jgi:hypothetical protein